MNHLVKVAFGLALCLATAMNESGAETLRIHVSVPPQAYFVERIGGDRVEVNAFVPSGESCESFQPRPAHMRALARAQVFFTVGLPYEGALVPRLSNIYPNLVVVPTHEVLSGADAATCCSHHAHSHEHAGSHAHERHGDPHVWMSPGTAIAQAERIRAALSRIDPAGAAFYAKNFSSLAADIKALDTEIRELLSPFQGRPMFVYHPAFGHFAGAYGLEQVAIEHNGADPSPARLARLVGEARERGVRVFFVQPAESVRSADLLAAAVGGRTQVLDPMRADWADNMREIALAVAASFAGEDESR